MYHHFWGQFELRGSELVQSYQRLSGYLISTLPCWNLTNEFGTGSKKPSATVPMNEFGWMAERAQKTTGYIRFKI